VLSCSVVSFVCVTSAIFCTYLSPVYHSTIQYSVNKGFYKSRGNANGFRVKGWIELVSEKVAVSSIQNGVWSIA